jgi:competence protein ComGC
MSIQHTKTTLFLKLVCFFRMLAGRFHNFKLTQNREKTRNSLTIDGTITEKYVTIRKKKPTKQTNKPTRRKSQVAGKYYTSYFGG